MEKLVKELRKNFNNLKLIAWKPNVDPGLNEFAIKNFEFKGTHQFILISHCENFKDIVNYFKNNNIDYEVVREIGSSNKKSSSRVLFEKKA